MKIEAHNPARPYSPPIPEVKAQEETFTVTLTRSEMLAIRKAIGSYSNLSWSKLMDDNAMAYHRESKTPWSTVAFPLYDAICRLGIGGF